MKSELEESKRKDIKYPCLMKNPSDLLVILAAEFKRGVIIGTVVHPGQTGFTIGKTSDWMKDDFVPLVSGSKIILEQE